MHSMALRTFFFEASGHPRDLHSFPTRRSSDLRRFVSHDRRGASSRCTLNSRRPIRARGASRRAIFRMSWLRSEEHTSELQSQSNLVCRLLLEKKNNALNLVGV